MLDYDLKELLKTKTTFAIMQYFISFIAQKTETIKKYELMYINAKKTNIKFIPLSAEQFKYIKEMLDFDKKFHEISEEEEE